MNKPKFYQLKINGALVFDGEETTWEEIEEFLKANSLKSSKIEIKEIGPVDDHSNDELQGN